MHFSGTVAIGIAGPFVFGMADSETDSLDLVIAVVLIGLDRRFHLGELLHKGAECFPLGILHDPQAHLT
jgi:hypothetical protein